MVHRQHGPEACGSIDSIFPIQACRHSDRKEHAAEEDSVGVVSMAGVALWVDVPPAPRKSEKTQLLSRHSFKGPLARLQKDLGKSRPAKKGSIRLEIEAVGRLHTTDDRRGAR
jgi:hypothetical protein